MKTRNESGLSMVDDGYKEPVYRYPKELGNNYALKEIYARTYFEEQDCLVAVVGDTGSGKTNFAVSCAERLSITPDGHYPRFKSITKNRVPLLDNYSDFNITPKNFNYVVPDLCYGTSQLKDFWNRMNNLAEKNIRYCYGRPAVIEEAQNTINSRTYYGKSNMESLRNFLTGRVFQNIYFLTYPSFNDIDKQIRKLLHFRVDMLQPDRKNRFFNFRFKKLKDVERNEYGNYLIDRSYKVDDFFTIPKKENAPISIRSASPSVYQLTRLKGIFWKKAVRSGHIDPRNGDYVLGGYSEEKDSANKYEERKEKLLSWARDNYSNRKEYYHPRANRYVATSVVAGLMVGGLSFANSSHGRLVIEAWKVMEKEEKT